MIRAARLAPVLLVLAACAGDAALPPDDLLLTVSVGAESVATGAAFPVTVVRQWSKDLEPAPWDERALAPLVLRLESSERREDAHHVAETRRYRGYAFGLVDLRVPAAVLEARPQGGGPPRRTSSAPVRVRVRPEVPRDAPGAPELPGEPLAEPVPSWTWWAGAGLAFGTLLGWRKRRRAARAPVASPPEVPSDAAARLAAIEARASDTPEARVKDVDDVAQVLRGHVARRWGVRTAERTTEEVVESLPPGPRAALATLLAACDRVRYAAHVPTPEERAALLAGARAFVLGGEAGP